MEVALHALNGVAAYNAVTAFCIIACAVMLVREWKRADRIETELKDTREKVEAEKTYRQEVMEPLLRNCREALENSTNAVSSCRTVIERNTRVIEQLLERNL